MAHREHDEHLDLTEHYDVSADSWVTFTRRTEDPKLKWLEGQLWSAGIPNRRKGRSFHAPILEVPREQLDDAWAILIPVDDVPDSDPRWNCS